MRRSFFARSTTASAAHAALAAAHTALVGLGALAVLLTVAQSAVARPKTYNGCTSKQLEQASKTKDGKKCLAQGEKDVLNGSSLDHRIYCSSSGKFLCCLYDDKGNQVDNSCETIQEFRLPRSVTSNPLQPQRPTRPPGELPNADVLQNSARPGLLENVPVLSPAGPAATGAPASTAPPPVKLY